MAANGISPVTPALFHQREVSPRPRLPFGDGHNYGFGNTSEPRVQQPTRESIWPGLRANTISRANSECASGTSFHRGRASSGPAKSIVKPSKDKNLRRPRPASPRLDGLMQSISATGRTRRDDAKVPDYETGILHRCYIRNIRRSPHSAIHTLTRQRPGGSGPHVIVRCTILDNEDAQVRSVDVVRCSVGHRLGRVRSGLDASGLRFSNWPHRSLVGAAEAADPHTNRGI